MGDGGKGSGRRPGSGYADGWDRIFGKKQEPWNPNDTAYRPGSLPQQQEEQSQPQEKVQ